MYREKNRRSLLKTISWRLLATCTTALIVYILTGKMVLAFSVGGIEAATKMILYFFHERLWNRIDFGKKSVKPFVMWFTGLSGAGKSTLSDKTAVYLKKCGLRVECLDGDVVRSIFPQTGFSREERDKHVKRIGFLASILERNGVVVLSSFVSPYEEARQFVRGLCDNFIEVYVKASVEECEQRDVKGLYKKARAGEIVNFTGIDDPYEEPRSPEIIIESGQQSVEESFEILKREINKRLEV